MIRAHAFNTQWWGSPVGIVTDPDFFLLPPAQRQSLLAPFDWVEYKSPLDQSPPGSQLAQAGFFSVDTQIEFRIGLAQVPPSPSLDALQVKFADESPFTVLSKEIKPFEHERFFAIPGVTPARLNDRIALWSSTLIVEHPKFCLQLSSNGKTQGWFLSTPSDRGLHLVLAMLHKDATLTGLHLYQKSLQSYAQRGARIGWAAFSVKNGPVHNIYAKLGAHFTTTTGCWLWLKPELARIGNT
jgi:hypothetical protein